jgi:chaperonin GroEL (HSP60 family)
MDKILVSSDGEVCVSNDGATILERMEVENEIAKVFELFLDRFSTLTVAFMFGF